MSQIKLVIMDVDGTLTDGKIYMGEQGEMMKAFHVKDGYAIADIMPKHNLIPIVLTARKSEIVANRCKELGISQLYQGIKDKYTALKEIADKFHIIPGKDGIYNSIAYIGDDIIDIACMRWVGIVGCPSDAVKEVKNVAHFISQYKGGNGAVREFTEWLIANMNESQKF